MNWFKKAQNTYQSDSDDQKTQKAERYFSIGHGDYEETSGLSPDYIIWVWMDGRILTSKKAKIDQESGEEISGVGTHGSLWGHGKCDRTFKGRYEPQTGRISIVKPCGSGYRPVPDIIISALNNKFRNITEIVEF